MKNVTYTLIILLISVNVLNAQIIEKELTEAEKSLLTQNADTNAGWKTGGLFGANFTQASFTNWASGGQNAIALNSILNVFANYKKNNSSWDNSLQLAYGFLKQENQGVRKTDDKIDFMSKYGYKASKNWYYAGLLNFKTQFAEGFNFPDDSTVISDFLAPAYALAAIGMDYKPSPKLTAFISPFTARITIVNNQTLANAGAFGVDAAEFDDFGVLTKEGDKIRSEYGGYLRVIYKESIMENVSLETKLELFSNYSDEPTRIDVNWEVLIGFKVNKYISATIATQLIYDHDTQIALDKNDDGITDGVGPRTQFKEVLGIGLSYKF